MFGDLNSNIFEEFDSLLKKLKVKNITNNVREFTFKYSKLNFSGICYEERKDCYVFQNTKYIIKSNVKFETSSSIANISGQKDFLKFVIELLCLEEELRDRKSSNADKMILEVSLWEFRDKYENYFLELLKD